MQPVLFAGGLRRTIPSASGAMDLVVELWRFLRVRKKFWLLPIIVLMLLVGGLLVLAEGSAFAPFMYTIF